MIQVVISRKEGEYTAGVLRPSQGDVNHDSCVDNKLLTPKQFSILSQAAPSHQRLFVGEQEPSSPCNRDVSHRGHPFISGVGCNCVCVCWGGGQDRQESLSLSCLFWQKQAFLATDSSPL